MAALNLSRDQIAAFAKDPQTIKQFELLVALINQTTEIIETEAGGGAQISDIAASVTQLQEQFEGVAAPFDPALVVETLTSGDVEASQIFDSEQLGEKPSTKILPGRSVKYRAAFAVQNPKDLTLGFAPSFEHDELIWTNNVSGI